MRVNAHIMMPNQGHRIPANSSRSPVGRRIHEQGSVLVVAVAALFLVGIGMAAYLTMVNHQRTMVARSEAWNQCMPICEAGIEEAFAHLNHPTTLGNFAKNGWAFSDGAYRKSRQWSDGYCDVSIKFSMPPVITAEAGVRAPLTANYIVRRIQVETSTNAPFPGAIVAKNLIEFKGGSTVDSFNSTNDTMSTSGQYDPAKSGDRATVLTVSTQVNAVIIGNNELYGSVGTGWGGSALLSTHGNVGDKAWNSDPLSDGTIQPGHFIEDVDIELPDATLPATFGATFTPGPGILSGTNYMYVLGEGDYSLSKIKLSSSEAIAVTGHARLYVSGSTVVSGSAYIYIAPGASLELYSAGDVSIGGSGVFNATGVAKNYSVVGLPTCSLVEYSGSSAFIGTVYAPNSNVKWSGQSASFGGIVAGSFTFSGGSAFHYDESLVSPVQLRPFRPISWLEF